MSLLNRAGLASKIEHRNRSEFIQISFFVSSQDVFNCVVS